jgi:DNA-binding LacI/PurR family transcriptional regulator
LAVRYRTTLVTVQKALSRLERAGFIVSRGREGSFVADRPPHLFRYGIVFSELPTSGAEKWHWSKFWSLLASAGDASAKDMGVQLAHYSGWGDWAHAEDVQRLVADLANHRLAGLINAGPLIPDTPLAELVTTSRVPVVQVASHMSIPTMSVRFGEPYDMVLARLHALSVQHLAMLMPGFLDASSVDGIVRRMREAGIAVRDSRIIGLDPRDARWVRNWTRLLMESGRPPQALWITDDNLVEQAALGLADAGVVVGRDLAVIAHANLPLDGPSPTGFERYGVDLREVTNRALTLLVSGQAQPQPQPKPEVVPCQWVRNDSA